MSNKISILEIIKAPLAMLAIFLLISNYAFAREEILSFISHIHIYEDSNITITEDITVQAEHNKIKRGIYRDFPTSYRGLLGNKIKVDFEIVEVLKNGTKEPFHTKTLSNGIRIYIGNKSKNVSRGKHTYTIKYKTTQQLGFFTKHDEFYWNVTGNGWEFPILEAKANVYLPKSISVNDVRLEAFTGRIGSTNIDYMSEISPSGNFIFQTTKPLLSNEGLTIIVAWPKGFITEPDLTQKLKWWINANLQNHYSILGFLCLLIFYLITWSRLGKDPRKGVIVPRYHPPSGFTPGALRYIYEMGHDKKAFSAAIINLAVKGYIKISEAGTNYELHKLKNAGIKLPTGEHAVLSNLFDSHNTKLLLKNKNHEVISSALSEHKKALNQEFGNSYFINNWRVLIVGLVITLFITLSIFFSIPSSNNKSSALFLIFWLSIWTPITAGLVYGCYKAFRRKLSGEKASDLGMLILFSGAWSAGEIGALIALGALIGIANGALLVLLIIVNIIFYFLLKKPTLKGRKLLDKAEGFKQYLKVAEQEELNLKYPPRKTPKLFETYLPFALALEVENEWGEQFSNVFSTSETSSDYHPTWYKGSNWNSRNMSSFTNTIGNSLSTAITFSSTAPGSSSGSSSFGGGGSSGGGGGGGGGGGW